MWVSELCINERILPLHHAPTIPTTITPTPAHVPLGGGDYRKGGGREGEGLPATQEDWTLARGGKEGGGAGESREYNRQG